MMDENNIDIDTPKSMPEPEENHTQADFIKNELNFDVDPNDPMTKASLSDHPADEWMDILGSGHLRKKVIKPGKPSTRPNRNDLCLISYIGRLEDGTIIEQEEEHIIQLGSMDVIQGIDLALALMDVEEEAELEVGPRFGYGSIGRDNPLPKIPPDSKLSYNITLKNVQMEPETDEIPWDERRKIGNQKRERGNWWFAREEYSVAIQCYLKALEYLSPSSENEVSLDKTSEKTTESVSDSDLQAILEDCLKVHNNLAAVQLKIGRLDAALISVDNVLKYQPQNVKALFRKGKILHKQGEHAKACAVLTKALKIEPGNKAIQKELAIFKKKSDEEVRHEKKLYRKMLGNPTNQISDNMKNKDKHKKVKASLTWSLLGGTVVAIVGIIAYKLVS